MYDMKKFNSDFDTILAELGKAEKVTKAILSPLSRQLLEICHDDTHPDVQPINRLLDVLTPVNRRAVAEFYKEFSGHIYSQEGRCFKGRDKLRYAQKQKKALEFLNDPLNNIWTWADRHLEIEAKPFQIEKVTQYITNALKKAKEANISQKDFIQAIIAGGIETDVLLDVLGFEVGQEEAPNLNFVEMEG